MVKNKTITDQEMLDRFRTRFNRDPTSEDIDRISSRVTTRSDARVVKQEREKDQELSFSSMLEGIRGVGLPATAEDVYSVMEELSQEEKRTFREKKINSMEKKMKMKRTIATLTFAGLLGVASGIGAVSYNVSRDYLVRQEISSYQAKKAELENRFFGPLPSLAEASSSTLTPRERDLTFNLYVGREISSQLNNPENIFYQTTFGNVRLEARKVSEKIKNGIDYKLLLLKRDINDNGILSGYLYDKDCWFCGDGLMNLLSNSAPNTTVIFEGSSVKIVYHGKGEMLQLINDKTQRIEGEATIAYKKSSEQLSKDFRQLYERGPSK